MRIEPTIRSSFNTAPNRRREDLVPQVDASGKGTPTSKKPIDAHEAAFRKSDNSEIVSLVNPTYEASRRLSPNRWRSYVPFIAQYIGQETAVETSERTTRRHDEFARKVYSKHTTHKPASRIIAQV